MNALSFGVTLLTCLVMQAYVADGKITFIEVKYPLQVRVLLLVLNGSLK